MPNPISVLSKSRFNYNQTERWRAQQLRDYCHSKQIVREIISILQNVNDFLPREQAILCHTLHQTVADSFSLSQSIGDDYTQSLLQYLPYALKQESTPPLSSNGEIIPPIDAAIVFKLFKRHPTSLEMVEFYHRRYLALKELIPFIVCLLRGILIYINCWTTVRAFYLFAYN